MHKEHGQSEFTKTVEGIKLAEERAEAIAQEAKQNADQILKKAKDTVMKMHKDTEDEIVKLKNAKFNQGKELLDEETKEIIAKSQKEAEKLRKTKLTDSELNSVLGKFVESL